MKKMIPMIFFLLTAVSALPAKTLNGDLTVTLTGFANDKGDVKIALVNTKESFEARKSGTKPLRGVNAIIHQGKAQHVFTSLPYGKYAIKVFHDENANGELDTNFLGIPKERYGFSNNVRGRFGLPDFEKAQFTFSTESPSLSITLE